MRHEIPGNLDGADIIITMPSEALADPLAVPHDVRIGYKDDYLDELSAASDVRRAINRAYYEGVFDEREPTPNPPRRRPTLEHPALDLYAGHDGFLVRTALIRSEKHSDKRPPKVTSGEDAARLCAHLKYADQEHMVVLSLSPLMQLRAIHETAIGQSSGVSQTMLHLVKVAVLTSSSAVIMVHNHPSGDPTPSPDDVKMTKTVLAGLECLGIMLLDHVIVATGGHNSFYSLGLLGS
jgi:DNA repair protein RadC